MRALSRRGALGLAATAILAGCSRAVGRGTESTAHAGDASTPAAVTSESTTVSSTAAPTQNTPPVASASPTPTGPALEYVHGPRTRAEVALTFHGAGDPGLARELLALLAGRRTTVTVMVVGTWLSANPSMAAAISEAGHELGNHTWSHPDLSTLNEAAVRTEIARCRDLLVSLTGSAGALFRQSAAQYSTPLIRSVAGSLGYQSCLSYDVDSLDWTDPGAATVRRSVASATAGSVVSLHLGHQVTLDALPGILDDLTARGLTPVTASRLLRP
jgi:peptidoglycan/xylan/chitin deacetylase (PgdA/CDA1 family)